MQVLTRTFILYYLISFINFYLIGFLYLNRGEKLACSEAWLLKLGNEELSEATDINNLTKKCLPSCEYETITTSISSVSFSLQASFHRTSYFCLALTKLARICGSTQRAVIFEQSFDANEITCNEIKSAFRSNLLCTPERKPIQKITNDYTKVKNFVFSYAKNNFAVLKVFIRDPYYTLIIQDEDIPFITFIGNAGGLLGLSMGLSFITFFEIFYHFLMLCSNKLFKIEPS
jgi:hypothetical protein